VPRTPPLFQDKMAAARRDFDEPGELVFYRGSSVVSYALRG
jgi:hypothetical protein